MINQTESVWDYPRPPKIEPAVRRIRIVHAGITLVDTTQAFRILETSHPPVYYLPQDDIAMEYLQPSNRKSSYCEFKGTASYWSIAVPAKSVVTDAAWSYGHPTHKYAGLKDHLAFYASRVDECYVDEERVVAQPGDFYGGWITSHVTGPFKGAPGTLGW